MDNKKIVITKVGEPTAPPPKPVSSAGAHVPLHRTSKSPRSILKKTIKGVRDPSKAAPLKKGMKKHTLKVFTEKTVKKHRKTLKKKISKMSDSKVKEIVQNAGLVNNPATPPAVAREILKNAAGAGFVSIE